MLEKCRCLLCVSQGKLMGRRGRKRIVLTDLSLQAYSGKGKGWKAFKRGTRAQFYLESALNAD